MRAALETLVLVAEGRRRVAILGDMLELGDHAHAAHEEVGRAAARANVDLLVACGPTAQAMADGAAAAGLAPTRSWSCRTRASEQSVPGRPSGAATWCS